MSSGEWIWRLLLPRKRDGRRENTGKHDLADKIGLAQFLEKSSSKCAVTHQFLCTLIALAAFIESGRTGTWEHPETVFRHDAIEKHQVRVVVAGHAACREVSQTASFLCSRRRKGGRGQ
jgi:hypothetical protein